MAQAWIRRSLWETGELKPAGTAHDVAFFDDGAVAIANRLFPAGTAVNFRWGPHHAVRRRGSSRLGISSQGERYVFEFCRGAWSRLFPIAKNANGTVDLESLVDVERLGDGVYWLLALAFFGIVVLACL